MSRAEQTGNPPSGYAMAALLVALAVMAVAMTVALPAWRHEARREKEEELVFRGRQYVRAIQLFQRKYAAAYPPDADVLVKQKFLRKKYRDPMVEDGEFEILYQGSQIALGPGQARGGPLAGPTGTRGGVAQSGPAFTFDSRSGAVTQGSPGGRTAGPRGGMLGVRSKSTEESIRAYNGATHYNEWQFVFVPAVTAPAQGRPGTRGGPGATGAPGGRGVGPRGGATDIPRGMRGVGGRSQDD